MSAKLAVKIFIGGAAGWFSNEAYRQYEKKNRSVKLPLHDVKHKLAKSWSNDFKVQIWDENWDKKSVGASQDSLVDENNNPIRSKATRHIIFIRHGQYNLKGETDEERTLTNLGLEQATQTGKRLASLGLPIMTMVVSTMTRARETADRLQKELPPGIQRTSTDLLREGAPFPPEPRLKNWRPESHQYLCDGPRIEEAFRSLVHRANPDQRDDSYELVVCHANVIRYVVCRALQLPPEAWARMSLKHASITWLSIRPSGHVTLRLLGDSGFMPPKMLSS